MTWKERVKLDEMYEDKRAIDELDGWEGTILKEANPNYKDPDKFFEEMDTK